MSSKLDFLIEITPFIIVFLVLVFLDVDPWQSVAITLTLYGAFKGGKVVQRRCDSRTNRK